MQKGQTCHAGAGLFEIANACVSRFLVFQRNERVLAGMPVARTAWPVVSLLLNRISISRRWAMISSGL